MTGCSSNCSSVASPATELEHFLFDRGVVAQALGALIGAAAALAVIAAIARPDSRLILAMGVVLVPIVAGSVFPIVRRERDVPMRDAGDLPGSPHEPRDQGRVPDVRTKAPDRKPVEQAATVVDIRPPDGARVPVDASTALERSRQLLKSGDLPAAEEALVSLVVSGDPAAAFALLGIGMTSERRGDFDRAEQAYRAAADRGDRTATLLLAQLRTRRGSD